VAVDIRDDFRDRIPEALASAGGIPSARPRIALQACGRVVDAKRAAVNLTYRESKTPPPKLSPRSWRSSWKPLSE
jgi:hypothetical protein